MARFGFCVAFFPGGVLFHFILYKIVDQVAVVIRNACMNIKIMLDCTTHYFDHQRFSGI